MKSRLPAFILFSITLLLFHAPCVPAEGESESTSDKSPQRQISPRLQRILTRLDKANSKVSDLTATVDYSRSIPLLDEKEEAEGTLQFLKPDMIHLKLGKPRNEEVYSDGKVWWIIDHDKQQVEIYKSANRGQSVAEASFLTFGYGKSSDALLKEYAINIIDTKTVGSNGNQHKRWLLSFTPRDKKAPARFSRIDVQITDQLWLPEMLVLYESDGEIVHRFKLSSIKLNTNLEKSSFQYKPESGYTIVRPE